jgi:xanthine dehydrogenase accessory factor
MREVLADVERWRAAGQSIALATVVSIAGSAPRGVGATLAVSEAGEISGSVSGGCVEPAVIEEGLRAIRTGEPKLLTFGITEEQNVEQIGLSCGGEIRVFVERLAAPTDELLRALAAEQPIAQAVVIAGTWPQFIGRRLLVREDSSVSGSLGEPVLDTMASDDARALLRRGESGVHTHRYEAWRFEVFVGAYLPPRALVIVGAGHISIPLSRLAGVLGYRVTVVDARAAFATRARLPEADELLVEWPDEALERLPISSATAVAVLTHDDKFDVPALRVALARGAGYVGAIGSRGTRAQRDARLREAGVPDEQIARIHGPIGLGIGAQTPEEIALAILAEIVAVGHGQLDATRRAASSQE